MNIGDTLNNICWKSVNKAMRIDGPQGKTTDFHEKPKNVDKCKRTHFKIKGIYTTGNHGRQQSRSGTLRQLLPKALANLSSGSTPNSVLVMSLAVLRIRGPPTDKELSYG